MSKSGYNESGKERLKMKLSKCSKVSILSVGFFIAILFISGISFGEQAADPNLADDGIQITILYDNYTLTEGCRPDWGFACIIKGTEKCILFDTGADGNLLLENMDKLEVDAGDVELVVISHEHYDHVGGLSAFLSRNSNVTAYLPLTIPADIVQMVESHGVTVILPDEPVEIFEGVHLVRMRIGSLDEQFLILETPKGLVVITGCAHPGIVQIAQKTKQLFREDIYFVFGGFHLGGNTDSQVMEKIRQIQSLDVQKVGPSHCTGDRAIELFRREYGDDFVPMGIGPVAIPNLCDFNADGHVDILDLQMLIEQWGGGEPMFDIAPGLFGDGTVDMKDLEVFMDCWGAGQ